ncbi:MAG: M6 family metalloprotease domain-containing protein, partial [Deltaproteobacteria bacterium]
MFKHKHNKMFCMTFFFIAALSIVFLFAASGVSARPASSALHTLTQPDGYTFQARLWGDEYYHGWETEDGYTIILDESSKTWFYAVNDAEGNLVLSQYAVGQAGPPEGLKKYLRITGDALSRIQQRRIKRQPLSLDTLSMEPMAPKDGSNNVLTLLMNFSDTTTTYTRSQFEDLYFKKGNNSITDYYLENSYGKLTVTSGPKGVQEWWTAKNTHNYYGADDPVNTNINDVELPKAVRDLVTYWDSQSFNFAPYSQSGDCIVDTVAIVVQGKPQSSTGVLTDIWPKQSYLDPPYETKTTCDGSPNVKVKIKKYTIQTELEGEGNMATIGTFAHEYGHALGLPDLYDTSSVSKGLGNWATMAAGCDNKNPAVGGKTGDRPAHHDAWSKFYLGWITPVQVTSTLVNETIPAVEDASKVYQLLSGTPESGEYFLIENRQQKKFDIGLPGAGLLIWHIDGKVAKDNSILVNNKVNAMPCNNGTPCSVQHYGVALQQADGLWELEKNTNNGDAGDPYPGSTKN